MNSKTPPKIFLAVFILGLIISVIITSQVSSSICLTGRGCEIVNNSVYGSMLGIKNSVYGIFIFSIMILLTLFHISKPNKHTRRIIHAGIIAGSGIAVYFLYLQAFVIRDFCSYCLMIDTSMLMSFGFLIYLRQNKKNKVHLKK